MILKKLLAILLVPALVLIPGNALFTDNSITVGTVTSNKRIASFSNFGNAVDIYADGYALNSYGKNGFNIFCTDIY